MPLFDSARFQLKSYFSLNYWYLTLENSKILSDMIRMTLVTISAASGTPVYSYAVTVFAMLGP